MKLRLIRAAAAASMVGALTVPAAAHASFVLDTGTPTGASTYALLTSPYDVEFAANPGETITSIAAYLTVGSGQPGDNVLFEIFTAAGISNRNAVPVYSTEATFHANGWTSASASWTPSAAADYWLVVAPVTGQGMTTRQVYLPAGRGISADRHGPGARLWCRDRQHLQDQHGGDRCRGFCRAASTCGLADAFWAGGVGLGHPEKEDLAGPRSRGARFATGSDPGTANRRDRPPTGPSIRMNEPSERSILEALFWPQITPLTDGQVTQPHSANTYAL